MATVCSIDSLLILCANHIPALWCMYIQDTCHSYLGERHGALFGYCVVPYYETQAAGNAEAVQHYKISTSLHLFSLRLFLLTEIVQPRWGITLCIASGMWRKLYKRFLLTNCDVGNTEALLNMPEFKHWWWTWTVIGSFHFSDLVNFSQTLLMHSSLRCFCVNK